MSTIEEQQAAIYERAARVGLQKNSGPDIVCILRQALIDDATYSTSINDGVRTDELLSYATENPIR